MGNITTGSNDHKPSEKMPNGIKHAGIVRMNPNTQHPIIAKPIPTQPMIMPAVAMPSPPRVPTLSLISFLAE